MTSSPSSHGQFDRSLSGPDDERALTRSLAADFFQRTRATTGLGIIGALLMAVPHLGAADTAAVVGWFAAMSLVLLATYLAARRGARLLEANGYPIPWINLEAVLAALRGACWAVAIVLFDDGATDALFFFRMMLIAGAVAFVMSTMAFFLRVFAAFVATTFLGMALFLATAVHVAPLHDLLLVTLSVYAALFVVQAMLANRQARWAAADHLSVLHLSQQLAHNEDNLRQRIEARTNELTETLAELNDAKSAAEDARDHLAATLDAVPDLLFEFDGDGRYCDFHASQGDLLIARPERFLGRTVGEVLSAESAAVVMQALRQAAETGSAHGYQVRMATAGTERWFELSVARKWNTPGQDRHFIVLARDISQRKRAEQELSLYANVFHHSGEAIVITDAANHIVAVNPAFTRHTGYTLEEIFGRDPRMLAAGQTPPETYQAMWAALNETGFWQGELWDRRKDGQTYPKWAAISVVRDDAGTISHHTASFTDITERKAAEARIDRLAHHDPLTGLFNRFSLENRLEQTLLTSKREGGRLAVMFVDLDRFKLINDSLGHQAGDALLAEAARRLQACVRESDIVARLGGDEFVVVLGGIDSGLAAAAVAGKIVAALAEPYQIGGREFHSSGSMGIAVFPEDGDDSATLMRNADTALYHAKDHGRNNYQFFAASMTEAAAERLELERDLRIAIAGGRMALHYQPIVDVRRGRVTGVEALLRWHHPARGLLLPAKFIPIAEESGLIQALGNWVLGEACRQAAAWRAGGIGPLRVSVNISAQQLRTPALAEQLRAAMAAHAIGEDSLELEVTESTAMEDPDRATQQLAALRRLGVTLAIDDFGTGYSSLAYLKLLPIQTLKLDRAFVRDIETDANDAAISAATLALAHTLGLKVVAEGVETPAQRDFLVAHGCDYLQGNLFGEPVPADAITALLLTAETVPTTAR